MTNLGELSPNEKIEDTGAMTVREFLSWASISNTTFYSEVNAKRIEIRKCGRRTLVPRKSALAWLNNLPSEAV